MPGGAGRASVGERELRFVACVVDSAGHPRCGDGEDRRSDVGVAVDLALNSVAIGPVESRILNRSFHADAVQIGITKSRVPKIDSIPWLQDPRWRFDGYRRGVAADNDGVQGAEAKAGQRRVGRAPGGTVAATSGGAGQG